MRDQILPIREQSNPPVEQLGPDVDEHHSRRRSITSGLSDTRERVEQVGSGRDTPAPTWRSTATNVVQGAADGEASRASVRHAPAGIAPWRPDPA